MPTMWQHQRKQTSWGLANITFFACKIVLVVSNHFIASSDLKQISVPNRYQMRPIFFNQAGSRLIQSPTSWMLLFVIMATKWHPARCPYRARIACCWTLLFRPSCTIIASQGQRCAMISIDKRWPNPRRAPFVRIESSQTELLSLLAKTAKHVRSSVCLTTTYRIFR